MVRYGHMRIPRMALRRIAKRFGLTLVLAFGSQVLGRARPDSDLDIAVLAESGSAVAGSTKIDLLGALARAFPGKEIDLVVLNRADPLLLKQIAAHCRLLYGSRRRAQEFCLYAVSRYQDFAPQLRAEAAYVAAGLGGPAA